MYFIEYNGFDRSTGNINEIPSGACILEIWSKDVSFKTPLERSQYFRTDGTVQCLSVMFEEEGVATGILKFRFAFNDEYIDHIYPMTNTLPSDEDLEQMLLVLL